MRSTEIQWDVQQEEWFCFMSVRFDVREAKRILASKSIPIEEIEVKPWFDNSMIVSKEEQKIDLETKQKCRIGVSVSAEAASKCDLSVPVILVQVKAKDGTYFPFIIDGYHRLFQANKVGQTTLPAICLNKKDSKLVMR